MNCVICLKSVSLHGQEIANMSLHPDLHGIKFMHVTNFISKICMCSTFAMDLNSPVRLHREHQGDAKIAASTVSGKKL